jgi:TM2 domain-containing membrane protein YozV
MEHWWDGANYLHSRPRVLPAPPAYPPQLHAFGAVTRVSPKSRTVASILGFFLGGLGVDRFYLGNIGMGVAKLLVGWLTAGIWPLIDWIVILAGAAHDGDGLPVTNWS